MDKISASRAQTTATTLMSIFLFFNMGVFSFVYYIIQAGLGLAVLNIIPQ
jgi:hypothetical protein